MLKPHYAQPQHILARPATHSLCLHTSPSSVTLWTKRRSQRVVAFALPTPGTCSISFSTSSPDDDKSSYLARSIRSSKICMLGAT
ncbi:uncharacterized protein PHALS_02937 [Plasmopara halstedii]|uniref:Uncharacterized protein n=1 Tax=Plasmopara halstedii TaxID=4781 RepID=A0A0P1AXX6_PLAHL|nr:uncharacterized protein PHALS_02937 [Plasmopara halstedii]CEG46537.1 hypothetical protein PHALS_02937 [Plasmopara halstedii]|eukprot:XP_024582906.1 hypothetical protein PHALS_02937 [Plasmopara halstedii]